MAILKAYFDDSGADKRSDDRLLTIAGYVSTVELWEKFDEAWDTALGEFDYLHMKEFGDPNGIYKSVKCDPKKEAAFMGGLVEIIAENTRMGVHTTVMLDDLRRFNREHNRHLNPYALAIHGCISMLQWKFPTVEIEVYFDKFDRASSLVEEGLSYTESDVYQPLKPNLLPVATPIRKDESFKSVRPIQAADLLAWEMRKLLFDRLTWINGRDFFQLSRRAVLESYARWVQEHTEKFGKQPRNRKSFLALRNGTRPNGYVFNYENLELLEKRHVHGWKVTRDRGLIVFSEGKFV